MAKKQTNASNWKYNPAVFNPHPWHKRKPVNWEMLTVHCAATKASMDVGVDQIDYWHRQRGFEGVGYNYIIRRNGTIEGGRPTSVPGAHATGYNRNSLSVCLVGGIDDKGYAEDNFTPAQFSALRTLVMQLVHSYVLTAVVGHRDLPDVHKDCPCFEVKDWLRGCPEIVELIEENLRTRFAHSV